MNLIIFIDYQNFVHDLRIIRVPPVCVSASFSSEGEDDTASVIRKSTLVSVDMLGPE